MKRNQLVISAALLAATIAAAAARAEMPTTPFMIRHAQDLVDLCTPGDPKDPLYDDAINFCHGFVSGAYQYSQAVANGPKGARLVCPPDPLPKRAEAIAMFVAWAKVHPEYMTEPAVEALFRFLTEKWPCAAPADAKKGASK